MNDERITINVSKLIDARGMSDEFVRRLPDLLKTQTRETTAAIKDAIRRGHLKSTRYPLQEGDLQVHAQYREVADARERQERDFIWNGKLMRQDDARYLWKDRAREPDDWEPLKHSGKRVYFACLWVSVVITLWTLYVLVGGAV